MSDEVERSCEALASGDLERVRRVEAVRQLLAHRKDPRVGQVLTKLIASEADPEVLKTAVLGLGVMRDRAYVKVLLPLLEHTRMRVVAAAIKSLCELDPNMEIQTLHPLLASKDDKARLAAVLALLSHNPRLGAEMVEQLAGGAEPLRLTAVKCLEAIELAHAHALIVKMFIAETKLGVLKEIALFIADKGLAREGLDELNGYRARMKAEKPGNEEVEALRAAKLKILDKLARKTYEKMDLSAGTIGTLEGQVDRLANSLEVKAAEVQRVTEQRRKTGQAQRLTEKRAALKQGPRWGRMVAGLVLVLGLGAAVQALRPPAEERPKIAAAKVEIASVLGKAGEHVSIEAEVLHVYRAQKSVALMAQGSVMICAVFDHVPDAQTGARVRLEGTIANVRGTTSLTVAGDKLTPAI